MKQSGPIQRRTPLKPGGPLRRTEFKQKAPKQPRGWAKARKAVRERSGGLCEVKTPACTGIASDCHHVLNRSQGGKSDVELLLDACRSCHDYIGHNPAEA
jgi:hypothetical protein